MRARQSTEKCPSAPTAAPPSAAIAAAFQKGALLQFFDARATVAAALRVDWPRRHGRNMVWLRIRVSARAVELLARTFDPSSGPGGTLRCTKLTGNRFVPRRQGLVGGDADGLQGRVLGVRRRLHAALGPVHLIYAVSRSDVD